MSDDFEMDDFLVDDDDIDVGPDEMSPSDDERTEADCLDMVRPGRAELDEEDAYRAWETEPPPARRWLREEARYRMPVIRIDEESGMVTFRDHSGRWRMMRGLEAVYAHLLKSRLGQRRRTPSIVHRTCRRRRTPSHHRASTARAPADGDGPCDGPRRASHLEAPHLVTLGPRSSLLLAVRTAQFESLRLLPPALTRLQPHWLTPAGRATGSGPWWSPPSRPWRCRSRPSLVDEVAHGPA